MIHGISSAKGSVINGALQFIYNMKKIAGPVFKVQDTARSKEEDNGILGF